MKKAIVPTIILAACIGGLSYLYYGGYLTKTQKQND